MPPLPPGAQPQPMRPKPKIELLLTASPIVRSLVPLGPSSWTKAPQNKSNAVLFESVLRDAHFAIFRAVGTPIRAKAQLAAAVPSYESMTKGFGRKSSPYFTI